MTDTKKPAPPSKDEAKPNPKLDYHRKMRGLDKRKT